MCSASQISRSGIDRVNARFRWSRYADTFLTLQNIYAFWRHVTHMDRKATRQYLEMFYALKLRPLMQQTRRSIDSDVSQIA